MFICILFLVLYLIVLYLKYWIQNIRNVRKICFWNKIILYENEYFLTGFCFTGQNDQLTNYHFEFIVKSITSLSGNIELKILHKADPYSLLNNNKQVSIVSMTDTLHFLYTHELDIETTSDNPISFLLIIRYVINLVKKHNITTLTIYIIKSLVTSHWYEAFLLKKIIIVPLCFCKDARQVLSSQDIDSVSILNSEFEMKLFMGKMFNKFNLIIVQFISSLSSVLQMCCSLT